MLESQLSQWWCVLRCGYLSIHTRSTCLHCIYTVYTHTILITKDAGLQTHWGSRVSMCSSVISVEKQQLAAVNTNKTKNDFLSRVAVVPLTFSGMISYPDIRYFKSPDVLSHQLWVKYLTHWMSMWTGFSQDRVPLIFSGSAASWAAVDFHSVFVKFQRRTCSTSPSNFGLQWKLCLAQHLTPSPFILNVWPIECQWNSICFQ